MSYIRKIIVVITARPSYSRVKTLLKAIEKSPYLTLELVLSGSSLLDRYGSAVDFIRTDGFQISDSLFNHVDSNEPVSMAKSTGLSIIDLSNLFYKSKPDMVITIADRYETIATSIAASYQNIPLVHIQGGEVTGNIDEKVRHSNTKLADLHFVASDEARCRVIKLGEQEQTVFNLGCPSIDLAEEALLNPKLDFDPFVKYLGVGDKFNINNQYIVVLQHPVTSEYLSSRNQMDVLLKVVDSLNINVFWFWPNIDSGSDESSASIRQHRENSTNKNIYYLKNMESTDFLKLLINSQLLVGNSSVGIRECSFLGVPVVNIGTRQNGRQRGKNVLDCDYSFENIKTSVEHQLGKKYSKEFIYGDGKSGEKIAKVLRDVKLNFTKKITY
jgi:UDP-hydrolysing UDP-N-acetyl-D-glucosamine 2-epimerase